jgi:hypothetical protein
MLSVYLPRGILQQVRIPLLLGLFDNEGPRFFCDSTGGYLALKCITVQSRALSVSLQQGNRPSHDGTYIMSRRPTTLSSSNSNMACRILSSTNKNLTRRLGWNPASQPPTRTSNRLCLTLNQENAWGPFLASQQGISIHAEASENFSEHHSASLVFLLLVQSTRSGM